jgi:outer membrane protein
MAMSHRVLPGGRGGFAAAWLAACLVAAGASPAAAASLTEALAASYNNNPTLLAARARLRATDENVPQALSGWRPTVQFTGQYGAQQSNTYGPKNVGTGEAGLQPRSLDLSLNQPIYSGGQTVAATSQAENLVRGERSRLLATEQAIFFASTTSYLDVLRDQAVLELSINNQQVLQKQLEATQDRFRVGEVTRTDVAQAESRLASAVSDRITAEGNLDKSRAAYERNVGEPPGFLTAPTERPVLPKSRAESVSLAGSNNPNVTLAQFTEAAARDAVNQAKGQLLPSLSIVGDLNHIDDTLVANRSVDTASITARVTVPLYEAGNVYSRVRQAQQTVGQRRSELDDTRRQVMQAAAQAWDSVQTGLASVESFRSQIRAAEIALEGVQQEALVGSRTVLDVLNAEQELFTARVNLVRAQHDEIVAEFDLSQQVGRLTALDLKLPVELYDANKNYNAVRNKWAGFSSE